MTTQCTFFDPNTTTITMTCELSDETLEHYVSAGAHALLDVQGDSAKHYVLNNALVEYTADEQAALASLQDGWKWQMPERVAVDQRSLAAAKDRAWERIKASRDIAEHSQFTCDGHTYDADEKATGRIQGATNGAMMAVMSNSPYSIDFTLADNTSVTMTAQQMMAVGGALIAKVGAVFDKGRTKRDAIDAATTNAAADAITWEST